MTITTPLPIEPDIEPPETPTGPPGPKGPRPAQGAKGGPMDPVTTALLEVGGGLAICWSRAWWLVAVVIANIVAFFLVRIVGRNLET